MLTYAVMEDGSTLDLKDNINRTRYLGMLSYQDPQRMLTYANVC